MTDDRPDLTKSEVRQGNSRKMNSRALIFGLIGLVILFALVYWFSTATYDETATTTGGGTTLEDAPAAGGDVGDDVEDLPTPTPDEPAAAEPADDAATTEPAVEAPAAEAPAETEAPADAEAPAETEEPAAAPGA